MDFKKHYSSIPKNLKHDIIEQVIQLRNDGIITITNFLNTDKCDHYYSKITHITQKYKETTTLDSGSLINT